MWFWKRQEKPPQKTRIFTHTEPPKTPGKKGKTLRKEGVPGGGENREFNKEGKEGQPSGPIEVNHCLAAKITPR